MLTQGRGERYMSVSVGNKSAWAKLGFISGCFCFTATLSALASAEMLINENPICSYSYRGRVIPAVNFFAIRAAYDKDKAPHYDYIAAAIMSRLIERWGCSVDAYGPGGTTALQIVVQGNLPILVGTLIRSGADPYIKAKSRLAKFRDLNAFQINDENLFRTLGAPITLEVRSIMEGMEK